MSSPQPSRDPRVARRGRSGVGAGAETRVDGLPQGVVAAAEKLLRTLGIDGQIFCRDRRGDDTPHLWVEVLTRESGLLIGDRGTTLRAFEHILRLLLRPLVGDRARVMVDVNAYRARQMEVLQQRAREAADRARLTGRAVVLDPMGPADRRVIHVALATAVGVTTESHGEGEARRVIVRPTDPLA